MKESASPAPASGPAADRGAPGDRARQILLSLLLTGASIVYVVEQALVRLRADEGAAATTANAAPAAAPTRSATDGRPAAVETAATGPVPPAAPDPALAPQSALAPPPPPLLFPLPAEVLRPADPLPAARPNPQPSARAEAPAAAPTPPAPVGRYRDGVYLGHSVSAVFGLVQVEVTIKAGRIAEVETVDYPASRRTSRRINDPALPVLRSEAISNQSAAIDIISGATLTCIAYARSLATALAEAQP